MTGHTWTRAGPTSSPLPCPLVHPGVRRGFAHAYNALVEDPGQRERGTEIVELVFPKEILSYNPLVYTLRTESAYETYLKSKAKKKDD